MIGPCEPWVTAEDLTDLCPEPTPEQSGLIAALCEEASQVAFALLGRKFPGPCTATVRPVLRGDCCHPCGSSAAIPLHNPVVTIDEVKINGEAVDDWHLRAGHVLHRNTGAWPGSQKVYLADTEADTFSIRYTFAAQPPALAKRAAAEIVREAWNTGTVDPRLYLPPGTTSATRQGMSISADPEHQPQYPVLLQAISAFNPTHSEYPAEVFDPDPTWDLVVVTLPG